MGERVGDWVPHASVAACAIGVIFLGAAYMKIGRYIDDNPDTDIARYVRDTIDRRYKAILSIRDPDIDEEDDSEML